MSIVQKILINSIESYGKKNIPVEHFKPISLFEHSEELNVYIPHFKKWDNKTNKNIIEKSNKIDKEDEQSEKKTEVIILNKQKRRKEGSSGDSLCDSFIFNEERNSESEIYGIEENKNSKGASKLKGNNSKNSNILNKEKEEEVSIINIKWHSPFSAFDFSTC